MVPISYLQRSTASILFGLATAASVSAQSVLPVGPGGFPSIPAALAVAHPGDILDLAAGTYPAFDCSVGVTLRAVVPGSVQFDLSGGFLPGAGGSMQFAAPAGQSIQVVGVRFSFPDASPTVPALQPQLALGSATVLEDCTLSSASGNARGSLLVGPAAVVHLQNVVSRGPVLLVDGRATAVQCDLRGPSLLGFTPSAVLVTGSLHASHSVLVGGASSLQPGGPGLHVEGAGRAWLTDCSIERGVGIGTACAVAGAGAIELARCTTNTPVCVPAAVAAGLGVQRSTPVVGGGSFVVAYRTEPSAPIGVHVSFALASTSLPFAAQPWGAPLGGSFDVGFALADGVGGATFSFVLPPSPVFRGLPLWLHGWSGWSLPLQIAPPAGGLLR
jgi:hypothetical protein